MEIHVQRITYADGRCTVYIPPRQHCLPQEIPFKNCKGYFRKEIEINIAISSISNRRRYNESISHLHLKNTSMFTPDSK